MVLSDWFLPNLQSMKTITTLLTSVATVSVLSLGLTGVALTSTLALTYSIQQDEGVQPALACFELLGPELCEML